MGFKMKKLKALLIAIQIFGMLSSSICFMWLSNGVQALMKNPFGLSDRYVQLYVVNPYLSREDDKIEILTQLYEVVRNQDVTIILDDIDSLGLGIYDPHELLSIYKLKDGTYFNTEDFSQNKPVILVQDNSFIQKYGINIVDTKIISKRSCSIKGVYDSSYPLATIDHQYIYNMFADHYLNGNYYIDTPKQAVMDAVLKFMNDNHFDYTIVSTGDQNHGLRLIITLLTDRRTIMVMAGMVMLVVSYFLFFFNLLYNKKSIILVSLRFGATVWKLSTRLLEQFHVSLLFGILLGALLHYLINLITDFSAMPFGHMLLVMVFHAAMTYIIWAVAFGISFRYIKKSGKSYV